MFLGAVLVAEQRFLDQSKALAQALLVGTRDCGWRRARWTCGGRRKIRSTERMEGCLLSGTVGGYVDVAALGLRYSSSAGDFMWGQLLPRDFL